MRRLVIGVAAAALMGCEAQSYLAAPVCDTAVVWVIRTPSLPLSRQGEEHVQGERTTATPRHPRVAARADPDTVIQCHGSGS